MESCSLWNLYEKIHGYQQLDEVKREYIYHAVATNGTGLEASPEISLLPKYPPKQL